MFLWKAKAEAEYSELGCGTGRSKVDLLTAGGAEHSKIEAEDSRAGEKREHFNMIYVFIS